MQVSYDVFIDHLRYYTFVAEIKSYMFTAIAKQTVEFEGHGCETQETITWIRFCHDLVESKFDFDKFEKDDIFSLTGYLLEEFQDDLDDIGEWEPCDIFDEHDELNSFFGFLMILRKMERELMIEIERE